MLWFSFLMSFGVQAFLLTFVTVSCHCQYAQNTMSIIFLHYIFNSLQPLVY